MALHEPDERHPTARDTVSPPLDRRQLLTGLAGVGLGCAQRRGDFSLPDGPITLGWRWVPGLELSYRTVMARQTHDVVVRRVEEWTYLVRDLGRNTVATLDGRLTGLGIAVEARDTPLPEPLYATALSEERDGVDSEVQLEVGMDGRVVSCTLQDFDAELPHIFMAQRLPARSVLPNDEWADPGLASPFTSLFPPEMPLSVDASSQLTEMHVRAGITVAIIGSRAVIRGPTGGPTLLIRGQSEWNADRGILEKRHMEVTFLPNSADPIRPPGQLEFDLVLA